MTTPFSENGGFAATNFFLMLPVTDSSSGAASVAIFDPSSFDDPDDDAAYSWRAEDVIVGRVPTIRRVILVYRDLGPATLTVTISGTNDNGNTMSASAIAKLGTNGASGNLMTALVDLSIACFRPQLEVSRKKGGGPISIVSATIVGEVEDTSL